MDRSEFDIDAELEKYDYAAAVRDLGFEPHPTMAGSINDTFDMPVQNVDDFFVKLGNQTKKIADETARTSVAAPRQIVQEAIDFGVDWFGEQLKDFYTVNGFASDDQVKAILPQSMTQYAKDKGVPLELPLKSFQPETGIGTTARELLAYIGGFLLTKGKGAARQAGDTVLDDMGRHAGTLLQGVRGSTGGAMSLNVKEANLSELAVELGFADELRVFFDEQSMADRAAEGIADQIAMRANSPMDADYELTAEQRLNRKVDTVVEENAVGGILATAIMSTAKLLKLAAVAPKTSAGLTAGATAAASDDAEGMPVSRLARGVIGSNIDETATNAASAAAKQLDTDFMGFYSKALESAKRLPQKKATGEQYLRMLSKSGVTDDELYWTGLQDFANEAGKMNKDQLVNYLERNRVRLDELEFRSAEETPDTIDFIEEAVDGTDEIEFLKENIYETAAERVDQFQDFLEANKPMNDSQINQTMDNFKKAIVDGDAVDTQYLTPETESLFDEFAYYNAGEMYDENPLIRYTPDRGPDQTQVDYEIVGQEDIYTVVGKDGKAIETFDDFASAKEKIEQLAMDDGSLNTMPTQYEKWTQPGGSDYREHVIRIDNYRGDPGITDAYVRYTPDDQREFKRLNELNEEAVARGTQLSDADQLKFDELKARATQARERMDAVRQSDSSHFEEYENNIVAHYRTKERRTADGKRILYVEEIQSDWAGEGRKRGFMKSTDADDEARIAEVVEESAQYRKTRAKLNEVENLFALDRLGELPPERANYATEFFPELKNQTFANKEEKFKAIQRAARKLSDDMLMHREIAMRKEGIPSSIYSESGKTRVPRAPFVYSRQTGKENTGAWTRLVLKRVLMQAAQEGYDGIAIASGRASADHYNLRKYFDWVDIIRDTTPHPVDGKPTYSLVAKPKDGGGSYTQDLHSIHEDELPGIIGQAQAARAIKALESKQQRTDVLSPDYNQDNNAPLRLAGSDLASGGEGMLDFYDKVVPASMSKVLSKIDRSVKPQQIGVRKSVDKTGGQRSDLDIGVIFTEELKEKLKKGLPLFMPPSIAVGVGAMADKGNQQVNTSQMEMQF